MKILRGICALLLAAAAAIGGSVRKALFRKPREIRMLYVVDGDTIEVEVDGRRRSVRLLGIDAPESKMNDRAVVQAKAKRVSPEKIVEQGLASREKMKTLLRKGDVLRLEFGEKKYDKYGRILAYVKRGDTGLNLNVHMLETGYAEPLFFGNDTKYEKEMRAAYARYLAYAARGKSSVRPPAPGKERVRIDTFLRTAEEKPEDRGAARYTDGEPLFNKLCHWIPKESLSRKIPSARIGSPHL